MKLNTTYFKDRVESGDLVTTTHTQHQREMPVAAALSGIGISTVELNQKDVEQLLDMSHTQIQDWLGKLYCRFLPNQE